MIKSDSFYVVGIGTSAGGLKSLTAFFRSIPAEIEDVCFVVVQHLLASHKSELAAIISRNTALEVVAVERDVKLEKRKIYVLREGFMLTVRQGMLRLRKRERREIVNRAVDIFFESMGRELKSRSVGIILSGMGSDGLRGARAIEQAGGKIMVQDPDSTDFKGMPNEIIYHDNPNVILPPAELAESLLWFLNLNGAVLRK